MSWLVLRFLFIFLLSIFILILLILVFPLKLSVISEVTGFNYKGELSFGLILGLISGTMFFSLEENALRLRLSSVPVYRASLGNKGKESGKALEEKPIKKPGVRIIGSSFNLLKPLSCLVKSMFKMIKLGKFELNLTAGLSDPYTSGMIFGTIFPMLEVIKLRFPAASIRVTPIFIEDTFNALLDTRINIRPILFTVPLLRFFFNKEFSAYRKSRRKKYGS